MDAKTFKGFASNLGLNTRQLKKPVVTDLDLVDPTVDNKNIAKSETIDQMKF